ncbi:hypothetical protein DdX_09743 [Ditylenchus destructor]|uniref:Uncharacterized protein n=1 Tax=Ditylenchus destructor TaxID=166010 RepID=A0AAD4QZU3_9BILA|nr:hypothetical protein DdX_09743 [Ditylenchus destructor]
MSVIIMARYLKFRSLLYFGIILTLLTAFCQSEPGSSSSSEEGTDPFGGVAQQFPAYFNLVRRQAVGSVSQLLAGPNITNIYEHLAELVGCDLRLANACSYVENRNDGSVIEVIREWNGPKGSIRLVDREKNSLEITQKEDGRDIIARDSRGNEININEYDWGQKKVVVKDGQGKTVQQNYG